MDMITFCVCVGIRGPIAEGDYYVGDAKVHDRSRQFNFGLAPLTCLEPKIRIDGVLEG